MFRLERKGGAKVSKGNYWNVANGERIHFDKDGVLPGDSSVSYLRFHPAAMLVVGPLMGLAYAIFLPLTAILMVLWVAIEKVFGGLINAVWKTAAFSWRPSEAYLAGKKTRRGRKAAGSEDAAEESKKEPKDSKS